MFWASWVVLCALSGLWALASPVASAPDEPAHIVRAVALVKQAELVPGRPGIWTAEVPHIYALTHEMYGCYAFRPEQPAGCWPRDYGDVAAPEWAETAAGGYNPLYYGVVGLPSLLEPRLGTLYLMRMMSALLGSLCLALALRSVAEVAQRRWTVLGVGVATTPMVVYMNGTVNPNSVEAAAGLGLWTVLLLALLHPDPALTTRRWWRAGVLVVLLVNAKALSPLYLALVVLGCVAFAGWRAVRTALADRRTWPGLALGVAGSIAAVGWVLRSGSAAGDGEQRFPWLQPERALDNVLRKTSVYVEQMIGVFGWIDTPAPGTAILLVSGVLGLLGVLALAVARRREWISLGGLSLAVVLLPIVLQVPNATSVGLPWQGRYLLAVAVGVPVLAGVVLDRRPGLPARAARRATVVALVLLGLVQAACFWWNLRRYVAGLDTPWFESIPEPWAPPVPAGVLFVAGLLVVSAVTALMIRLARDEGPPGTGDDGSSTAVGAGAGSDRAPRPGVVV
ncbi:DUF2142 domain-containing protein [Cellulomonas iranensis]|uniref:DUF2142 domain-containing protein n=1 Tax=Cellulomonas iranensis TaxID=76862 RepID=UPI003D7C9431